MTTSDQQLGALWLTQLDAAKPLFDLSENERSFHALQLHLEAMAEPIVTRLMAGEIRDGILSCVQRGSNSLGIEVPAATLETAAFARLRSWLQGQKLTHAISEFMTDAEGRVLARLSIHPVGKA